MSRETAEKTLTLEEVLEAEGFSSYEQFEEEFREFLRPKPWELQGSGIPIPEEDQVSSLDELF